MPTVSLLFAEAPIILFQQLLIAGGEFFSLMRCKQGRDLCREAGSRGFGSEALDGRCRGCVGAFAASALFAALGRLLLRLLSRRARGAGLLWPGSGLGRGLLFIGLSLLQGGDEVLQVGFQPRLSLGCRGAGLQVVGK